MLRSGLVNQHRARFEEGFPHERNNHPRDVLARPFVEDRTFPILPKSWYAEPELPVNAPDPIQPKYDDIFGKKTTPDERIYLYREFFNAAKKAGILGQPARPTNAGLGPGVMNPPAPTAQPVPPTPPPKKPEEGGGAGEEPEPAVKEEVGAPEEGSGPGTSSLLGGLEVDDYYNSELQAQVFTDAIGGNIGRGYDHEEQVTATDDWLNRTYEAQRSRFRRPAQVSSGTSMSALSSGDLYVPSSGSGPYHSAASGVSGALYPSVGTTSVAGSVNNLVSEPGGLYPTLEANSRGSGNPPADLFFNPTESLGPVVNGNVTSAASSATGLALSSAGVPGPDLEFAPNVRQRIERRQAYERATEAYLDTIERAINNEFEHDYTPEQLNLAYVEHLWLLGRHDEARNFVRANGLFSAVRDDIPDDYSGSHLGLLDTVSGTTRVQSTVAAVISQAESVNQLGSSNVRSSNVASSGRAARRFTGDLRSALPFSDSMDVDNIHHLSSGPSEPAVPMNRPRRRRRQVNYREPGSSVATRSTNSYRP